MSSILHVEKLLFILLGRLLSMVHLNSLVATLLLRLFPFAHYALDLVLFADYSSFEWKEITSDAAPSKLSMVVFLIKEATMTFRVSEPDPGPSLE